jgi:hypothetical protein
VLFAGGYHELHHNQFDRARVRFWGGALLGILLHAVLPEHHLSPESKDIVKLGVGLVGTMAALVLGLLVAAAKGAYDAQGAELTQISANIAALDRILANYGPETKEIRNILGSIADRAGSLAHCDFHQFRSVRPV